jgi:acetyl-CoA C-acetyltransferase
MRDAVICEPLRTPVGGFGGALRDVPAHELAATVIRALVERTELPPDAVDDVVLGHCYPTMDAPAIGRVAALDAGLPVTVPGLQIDRRCGSGLQAVLYAAMQVQSGVADLVLAGGAESMSNAPFYSTGMRWGVKGGTGVMLHDGLARGRVTAGGINFPVPGGMLETAENLRREYSIPRAEQDEFAVRSHRRAAAARDEGRFADEIVPVTVKGRKGDTVVDADEHIRPDSTVEKLAGLRPVLGRDDPDATVTAGNASGQNDGAAICVVTTAEKAAELGLRPRARIHTMAVEGDDPLYMLTGIIPATQKVLAKAGLSLSDIDAFEVNEAFASVVLAWQAETGADLAKVNINGGAIAIGHPLGASGARLTTTLINNLEQTGGRYGLQVMCEAGGLANATIIERI